MNSSNKIEVQILNAFTDNDQGGNPAGVVLNADTLTKSQKLEIASRVGLSETAFVSFSEISDFKLDFFTPTRQIAHCGHATIATFSYLSQLGKIKNQHSSKETIDGPRNILIQGELAFMEQRSATYTDLTSRTDEILQSLSLKKTDLLFNAPLSVVNTGNSFAIIPIANAEALKKIRPQFDLISRISEEFDLIGFYPFTTQTNNTKRDADTRMFAPRYGIEEEAGTGMAAGPLACYLYDILKIRKQRLYIQQGWHMNPPSPSLIIVDLKLENEKIVNLMAGGKGVAIKKLEIAI